MPKLFARKTLKNNLRNDIDKQFKEYFNNEICDGCSWCCDGKTNDELQDIEYNNNKDKPYLEGK